MAARARTTAPEKGCQLGDLFRLLGEAHVLDLLNVFITEAGPKRFVDLQARLSMSPNTLTDRLKGLVRAGLLTRTAYNETPPRVEYEATDKAADLSAVFDRLRAWARTNDLGPVEA